MPRYLVMIMLLVLSGGLLAQPAAGAGGTGSVSRHLQTLVLGAGCFWGAEKGYEALPGVVDAVSGYADGRGIAPRYDVITQPRYRLDPDNHAEVVRVTYNSQRISTRELLEHFFERHDPTQKNRQGNDVGTQYRSIILFENAEQERVALAVRDTYQQLLNQAGYGRILTEIKPLRQFHPAEDYHQDYLKKNPNGYCPDHATGVRFKPVARAAVDNRALLKGKHILVLEAPHCPYCEQFRRDVSSRYQGSIPLHYRQADGLAGLKLKTPTWGTPTIFFLDNGREVWARQGYVPDKDFYQALGRFKLGRTEAYDVAFRQGTDSPFCRQYDLFRDTPDGVFVDKLSGVPLFDTRDRFNSGTGWLSFTRAIAGSTWQRPDNSHGMRRTELLSKSTGIHLGHVFDDGPDGKPRFCINATVLEFRPRAAAVR